MAGDARRHVETNDPLFGFAGTVTALEYAEGDAGFRFHFGNTSSASIPLTIVTQLKDKCAGKTKFICCGFGVGLSWGTVAFSADGLVISDLVEVGKEVIDSKYVV